MLTMPIPEFIRLLLTHLIQGVILGVLYLSIDAIRRRLVRTPGENILLTLGYVLVAIGILNLVVRGMGVQDYPTRFDLGLFDQVVGIVLAFCVTMVVYKFFQATPKSS